MFDRENQSGTVVLAKLMVTGAVALGIFGCTQPGETTGVASATGGAIGAGLGAIIGSQTGDPGSGLVLGAAAGAGTGALIGNALEAHQKNLRNQDEAIERHAQTIKAQRAELEELRRLDREMHGARGSLRRGASAQQAKGSARSSLTRQHIAKNSGKKPTQSKQAKIVNRSATARYAGHRTVTQQAADKYRVRVAAPVIERTTAERTKVDTFVPAPVDAGTETKLVARDLLEEKAVGWDRVTMEAGKAAESAVVAEDNTGQQNIGDLAVREPVQQAAKLGATGEIAMSKSENCQRADSEITRANQATEGADKLFHLRRALRLCPEDADLHIGLGRVYRKLGRADDAAFEFGEALKLAPGHMTAIAELDRVANKAAE